MTRALEYIPMRYRLRTLLIAITTVCVLLGLWRVWEYLPGTFYRDQQGFPHGTGTARYYYGSGAPKSAEWHVAGVVRRVTLYRPDGSEIITTSFDKTHGGIGYFVTEDGTIIMKAPCKYDPSSRQFLAHGEAVVYDEDGNVVKTVRYQDGVEIGE